MQICRVGPFLDCMHQCDEHLAVGDAVARSRFPCVTLGVLVQARPMTLVAFRTKDEERELMKGQAIEVACLRLPGLLKAWCSHKSKHLDQKILRGLVSIFFILFYSTFLISFRSPPSYFSAFFFFFFHYLFFQKGGWSRRSVSN